MAIKHGVKGFLVYNRHQTLCMETLRWNEAAYRARRLRGYVTDEKGVLIRG